MVSSVEDTVASVSLLLIVPPTGPVSDELAEILRRHGLDVP
jgi:hypothetical protein